MVWMFALLSGCALVNVAVAWLNLKAAQLNLANAERNEQIEVRITTNAKVTAEAADGVLRAIRLVKAGAGIA